MNIKHSILPNTASRPVREQLQKSQKFRWGYKNSATPRRVTLKADDKDGLQQGLVLGATQGKCCCPALSSNCVANAARDQLPYPAVIQTLPTRESTSIIMLFWQYLLSR